MLLICNNENLIITGTRPELPEDIEPEYKLIVDIFNLCTEDRYSKRPSAGEILIQLETAKVID